MREERQWGSKVTFFVAVNQSFILISFGRVDRPDVFGMEPCVSSVNVSRRQHG